VWRLEDNGAFLVKSMYKKMEREMGEEEEPSGCERGVFRDIWKSPTPSKVVVFSWKLLHDRIPTRRNLALRNVLPPEVLMSRVLCEGSEESSIHLFLNCRVASKLWEHLMRWLQGNLIIPPNLFHLS